MKRRALSLLTALALVFSLCVPALAAETEDADATLGGATTRDWYYNAARWAVGSGAAGITNGTANNLFAPAETLTPEQAVTMLYAIDRNFDGVFDEKDAEVAYDFNLAVLTSGVSFSCANLFPSIMRDHGVMLLGHRSGGGTCAIQMMSEAEGFGYQISSYMGRLVNDAGEKIDDGVPVDVELLKFDDEGKADYSGLFDFDALRDAVNAFYAQKDTA